MYSYTPSTTHIYSGAHAFAVPQNGRDTAERRVRNRMMYDMLIECCAFGALHGR